MCAFAYSSSLDILLLRRCVLVVPALPLITHILVLLWLHQSAHTPTHSHVRLRKIIEKSESTIITLGRDYICFVCVCVGLCALTYGGDSAVRASSSWLIAKSYGTLMKNLNLPACVGYTLRRPIRVCMTSKDIVLTTISIEFYIRFYLANDLSKVARLTLII